MSQRGERQLMIVERLKQSTESSKEIMIAKKQPMHQKKQEDHTSKKVKSNLKFMLYTYNIDGKAQN